MKDNRDRTLCKSRAVDLRTCSRRCKSSTCCLGHTSCSLLRTPDKHLRRGSSGLCIWCKACQLRTRDKLLLSRRTFLSEGKKWQERCSLCTSLLGSILSSLVRTERKRLRDCRDPLYTWCTVGHQCILSNPGNGLRMNNHF